MNKKKTLIIGLSIIGGIALKLSLKFGASYGVTAAVVESSKSEPWDLEFKEAIVGNCTQMVTDEAHRSNQEIQVDVLSTYSATYCSCVFAEVEKEKIIPTKYNTYTTKADEYVAQVDELINVYMETSKGKKAVNDCITHAKQVAQRLPASEIESPDDEGEGMLKDPASIGTSTEGGEDL